MGLHLSGPDRLTEHDWFEISSHPLYRSAYEAPYGSITSLDAVPEAHAERLRLAASEHMHRLLADNSSDMIAVHDLDGTSLWVSAACRDLLGYEPHDLVGVQVFNLLHVDEAEMAATALAATLRDGARQRVTARLRRADGRYVWVDATGKGIFNGVGVPMTVQTNIRDATERVAAEHERDAALHRFQTAMEHAPIGMAVVTLDGYWLEANQALCTLLG